MRERVYGRQRVIGFCVLLFGCFAAQMFAQAKVPETYDELLAAIRQTRLASKARIQEAARLETIREAWQTGRLIDEHVLQHKERADYSKQVLLHLSADLGTSDSELYRMLQFYRVYPKFAPGRNLSWAHYRMLIAIDDTKVRKALEKKANRENWSRERLREEIRKINGGVEPVNPNVPDKPLVAAPGKIGAYRIIRATAGPYAGKLMIDLGFSNYMSLPLGKENEFQDREIISNETGSLQKIENAKDSDLFTYKAYIYKVLDGDTVAAIVDLGFGLVTQQTLRLRGIDAPELVTKEGEAAKQALEKMLGFDTAGNDSDARLNHSGMTNGKSSNKLVLIRTVKSDKYDRYLADIWVGNVYVNQKLIDDGQAVIVKE